MTDAPTFDQLRNKLLEAITDHAPANIGVGRATRMVDDLWPTIDALLFTGWEVNGERETWQQRSERMEERAHRAEALAQVLSDLDRCEHGRHEGDVCSGCGGPSKGNPVVRLADAYETRPGGTLSPLDSTPKRTIGFDLSANPIVVPERNTHDPDAWRTR